jgi:hypothetical protein
MVEHSASPRISRVTALMSVLALAGVYSTMAQAEAHLDAVLSAKYTVLIAEALRGSTVSQTIRASKIAKSIIEEYQHDAKVWRYLYELQGSLGKP